jgi:PAS domain S-box-containing protein
MAKEHEQQEIEKILKENVELKRRLLNHAGEHPDNNEYFQLIFNSLPQKIFLKNRDSVFVSCNSNFARDLGIEPEDIAGKSDYDFYPKALADKYTNDDRRLMDEKKSEVLEEPYILNGKETWVHTSKKPVLDKSGNVIGILGFIADISEKKKSEKALIESEERYRVTLDNMMEGCQIIGFDWKYLYVNEAVVRQGHQTKENLLGHTMMEVYPGIEKTEVFAHLRNCMEQRIPHKMENRFTYPDGSQGWFELSIQPVSEGVFMLSNDITERKLAEEALREREFFFKESQRAAFIGSYKTDFIKGYWESSEVLDQIFGIGKDYSKSVKGWLDIIHPDDVEMMSQYLEEEVIAKQLPFNKEYRIIRKSDGETRWVQGFGNVEFDSAGKIISMVGTIQDITVRKHSELERNASIEFLRLVNKSKTAVELIRATTEFFQEKSGCEAVGIRLKKDQDYPYYETRGFPKEFVCLENQLCSYDSNGKPILDSTGNPVLDCMCGNVISGRFDPSKSFFTQKGSFWSNCTTDLLASTTEADRQARTRNRCNGEGYESVALIGIKAGDESLGLLQLNDKLRGRFSIDMIHLWERLSDYLAVALSKFAAAEALHESEARFRTLVEQLPAITYMANLDVTSTTLYISPQVENILGYSQEEYLADRDIWFKLIFEDDKKRVLDEIHESHRNGEPFMSEYRMRTRDGKVKWFRDIAEIVRTENGQSPFLLGLMFDITGQKEMDARLRESDERYKMLAESAQDIINLVNRQFQIVYTNQHGAQKFGSTPEFMTGKNLSEIFPPEIAERQKNNLLKVFETGKTLNIEAPTVFPSGTIWTNTLLVPIKEHDGTINTVLTISRDVTDRKQAMEKAVKLSTAIEQSPVTIVITDLNGNIEYLNPAFTKITGYSFEEALGKNTRILGSNYHTEEFYKNLWETVLSGKNWYGEFRNKRKNGDLFWESASISPVSDDKGKITHFVAVKEDVTPYKEIVEDLIEAKNKAEESDRLKSAFLANMSHEIRTPMNGILGFTDLLRKPDLTDKDRTDYIDIIKKSGDRMLNTINDLIEISRIETGQLMVSYSETNLKEMLDFLFGFFKPQADQKNLKLLNKTNLRDEEANIQTDKDKLERVLINLIKNAIKFTDEGSIEFGCNLLNGHLKFYIIDTGIGIPEMQHEAIFGRFIQGDYSLSRIYEGSGLGLAISKNYIEMLDGKIWLESEPNKGTSFFFTIPYLPARKIKESAGFDLSSKNADLFKKLNILIAEDDASTILYLKNILMDKCNTLFIAKTGKEAIEKFRSNKNINLVLMDIKMPEMDGYTAARKIRELDKKVIIIAQTAYAFDTDREKAISAGCNDFLTKPVKEEELISVIAEHVSKRQY